MDDELIRKVFFISIIIIYLFTIIMYNYKAKPINDQVLIISLVSTIILLLILLVSFKVFPKKIVKKSEKCESEKYEKAVQSHKKVYRGVSQGKEEVYLYTASNFTDNGTIDSVKNYLQSKQITDPLASYNDILEAVNNGFVISLYSMFAWAADGFTYNISFDENYKPTWTIDKPIPSSEGIRRGIFLFGVKPPQNKYIFPPYNHDSPISIPVPMIHPWRFDLSSREFDMHGQTPSQLRPQLFYVELNGFGYNGLVKFEDAKIVANTNRISIANIDQIKTAFSYDKDSNFYLDNKVGWGIDGKLYKTTDGTNVSGTEGGVFFYGIKEYYYNNIHALQTRLIVFPFRYKITWSRWE
jgi:hypothetical protein